MFNWQLPNLGAGIFILVLWEAFWKAIGLWKSAKKGDRLWFIGIFIINLFGLVPLFYLWKTKQLETIVTDVKQFFRSKFKK